MEEGRGEEGEGGGGKNGGGLRVYFGAMTSCFCVNQRSGGCKIPFFFFVKKKEGNIFEKVFGL